MKLKPVFVLLMLTGFSALPQQPVFSGEVNLEGFNSESDKLPFWLHSNRRGRISEETNVAGWLSGKMNYDLGSASALEMGGGILYSDGFKDEIAIDQLYAQFTNSWLQVIVGRKQRPELYNGLSATNENILWSLNARPLPGIQVQTSQPIFFGRNRRFGFDAAWEEYLMGKNRFVQNARLHHKSFHLLYRIENGWEIKAGLQHFAQWAGTSPDFGEQPNSFKDYLRIVSGRGGDEGARQGDVENALGNHLGSWELYITKKSGKFTTQFIFNNIFEDGSGSRFANFPDGRYGIFVKSTEKNRWFQSLIYEFYYTRNQSHDVNKWGADNYLGHRLMYNSGFTYQDQILGAPFFIYDGERDLVVNNKFAAHHLGLAGNYSLFSHSYPYKLLLSYSHNEGTYAEELNPEALDEDVLYLYSEAQILERPFRLNFKIGADFNSIKKPVFGAGLSLIKEF
ncbi:hypothetical protein [Autumnicola musiva]|uniref:Capsule assembly protein Wzi n=1 Tax=Autumnicola musiva TaxID=3075589 RepID=A0ABU3D828_9FLAO|nr:hypothetical protein [Zunongwangia sp. F117]MDT0677684.1 hypothetical protein [Zunongwangia sp. F117]